MVHRLEDYFLAIACCYEIGDALNALRDDQFRPATDKLPGVAIHRMDTAKVVAADVLPEGFRPP